MYLHGEYLTRSGAKAGVHIVTKGERTPEVEIGAPGSGVIWSDAPVEIESSTDSTFDHLLRSGATVRIESREFISGLFCRNCRDAVVNITLDGRCVFAGYIEPQAYSQQFQESYDELSLNCIDALAAMQYDPYAGIDTDGPGHDTAAANAGVLTFADILSNTLGRAASGLDITGGRPSRIWYDGSKASGPDSDPTEIFSEISLAELLPVGITDDQTWKSDKAVEEICRYLNLHIIQQGLDFYIYDWRTAAADGPVTWTDILTGEKMTEERTTLELSASTVDGTDTQLTVTETYNRIEVAADILELDALIESPLDEEALSSPYTNRQKYLTEIIAEGEGKRARDAFYLMVRPNGQNIDYDGASMVDWYVQVRSARNWRFGCADVPDINGCITDDNHDQQQVPAQLPARITGALLSIGKVENKVGDRSDNSPVSSIDMTDYMVISVNGNGKDAQADAWPTPAALSQAAPVAEYTGNVSGGVFSPASDDVTNYIVVSGDIVLAPIMEVTDPYSVLCRYGKNDWELAGLGTKTVPSRNNEDGRLYTHKWWKADTPTAEPVWDDTATGFVPFTDNGPQEYEFRYSAVGDKDDKVSKVAVLACMLVIGDKCVVETGTHGTPSDFEWRKYKQRHECSSDDEYYSQCFYIGFDPKIGDKLIGQQYEIQNNVTHMMGIDATGTAIPVKQSDRVSGAVRFTVLGPVNTMWDDITRRHPTWFRHTKWTATSVPLLAHVSDIFVKQLEVKVYSDNGRVNNLGDDDLVYVTDTDEKFINTKDDITFGITSALTRDECIELDVAPRLSLTTAISTANGTGITSIYDRTTGITGKPERMYADSYYRECSEPRVTLTQCVRDPHAAVGPMWLYTHPAFPDKRFYTCSISRNVSEGTATVTIKETWS